jgi:hypothetical protein
MPRTVQVGSRTIRAACVSGDTPNWRKRAGQRVVAGKRQAQVFAHSRGGIGDSKMGHEQRSAVGDGPPGLAHGFADRVALLARERQTAGARIARERFRAASYRTGWIAAHPRGGKAHRGRPPVRVARGQQQPSPGHLIGERRLALAAEGGHVGQSRYGCRRRCCRGSRAGPGGPGRSNDGSHHRQPEGKEKQR